MKLTNKTIQEITFQIMSGSLSDSLLKTMCLSEKDQEKLTKALFDTWHQQTKNDHILMFLNKIIPNLNKNKQFHYYIKLIPCLCQLKDSSLFNLRHFIDEDFIMRFEPLEKITTAFAFSDLLKQKHGVAQEIGLWGLIQTIPHLHQIHQKEHAYEIYKLSQNKQQHPLLLEALTRLLFEIDHKQRIDLANFFADTLKNETHLACQCFLIDLLKQMCAALPENERLMIADQIAPFIYVSHDILVKKTISFFASTISLLPESNRFYYTQMIASLINDYQMRENVIDAVEKAIPYLTSEHEKLLFLEILSQFQQETTVLETEHAYIPVYFKTAD